MERAPARVVHSRACASQGHAKERDNMTTATRSHACNALLALAFVPLAGLAADDMADQSANPKNWSMQAGNPQNHRYSTLKQINTTNVKNLRVSWTFSTGVLRGHEGGPLVIGDMLYVHSPFPNKVFAIRLDD